MEAASTFDGYLEGQRSLHQRLEELRLEAESLLAELAGRPPSQEDLERLDRLNREREKVFQQQRELSNELTRYLRELEEASRRAAMSEKRPRSRATQQRSQEKIEKVSEDLTTTLRLERIDNAIKELLAFLDDAEFFAANASTGRRRRLRTLQNAISAALDK